MRMSEKPKVCIVGPSKKFLSGISYYNIRLSNCLSNTYNVAVICFRNLLPRFLFPGNKHVGKDLANIGYNDRTRVYDGMDYNNPFTWYGAYRFLKQEKPDIIVLQWWTSSVAHMHILISAMNSLFIGSKLFIEFHEVVDPLEESILPIRVYSRVMGRLLVKKADVYITHSESDKKLIAEKYRIAADRIHVVPHGLYDHYKDIPGKEASRQKLGFKDEYIILSFGLIRPYKGIPYLIKAFGNLPEEVASRSRLLIAGEIWEDRDQVENAILSSRYREKITLIDSYISDDDIPAYFSASDVVVLPYLRASQSGVAHIAMAFGKPIIVSKVGGLEESMSDYRGTFFIPPADTMAITEAILKTYKDRPGDFEPPKRGWDEIENRYKAIISDIMDKN